MSDTYLTNLFYKCWLFYVMTKNKKTLKCKKKKNIREILEKNNIEYLDIDQNTLVAITLNSVYKIENDKNDIHIKIMDREQKKEKIDQFLSLIRSAS